MLRVVSRSEESGGGPPSSDKVCRIITHGTLQCVYLGMCLSAADMHGPQHVVAVSDPLWPRDTHSIPRCQYPSGAHDRFGDSSRAPLIASQDLQTISNITPSLQQQPHVGHMLITCHPAQPDSPPHAKQTPHTATVETRPSDQNTRALLVCDLVATIVESMVVAMANQDLLLF